MAACLVIIVLAGCASDQPRRTQDLTVAAPTVSSFLYPGCHGRTVPVVAHLVTHGSRMDALRVLVTTGDGTIQGPPPTVRVRGGAAVHVITPDGDAAVIWFTPPGPCDGTCISMTVTVPPSAPCPYRLRLVPVLKAP
jgi:hypothetical protein